MAQYSTTNLIVNYLPQDMTDEQLRQLFDSQVPGVKSVKICRNNVTGYSYGYGFCDYDTQEAAGQAIAALNRRQVGSKTLKVAFARLRSEQTRNCKLRLSNLPAWITQEALQSVLTQYGSIINCKALLDQQQASCRGIGFCLYETRSSAEQAMAGLNGKPWPGSDSLPIQVRFADQNDKKVRAPSQQQQQQQQHYQQHHSQGHHHQQQQSMEYHQHHHQQQQHPGAYRPHYAAAHYAPPPPPPHHHPHHHNQHHQQQQQHHMAGYATQPAWGYSNHHYS